MLVNDDKEILLAPESLLQGDLSNTEIFNLLYNLLIEYIDTSTRDSCSRLRFDIKENLESLIALSVSDILFNVSELFTANNFDAKKAQQASLRCTQAKAQIKQVLLLGNLEEKLVQPDPTLVIFYQYVPEIFEALTSHNIFILKKDLQASINACVMNALNKDHQAITLTDANTGTKVAWYLGETLLKVALNMVSMSLGGAIIDSLHSALNTHGASIYELNKQKVTVTGSDGNSGNVFVRRSTDWERCATPKEILFQAISDIGDEFIKDADNAAKEGIKQRFAKFYQESRNGTSITSLDKSSAFSMLLLPIEILLQRLKNTEALIRRVIIAVIEHYVEAGKKLDSLDDLELMAKEVKSRLKHLKIHAYLTYLAHLANQFVQVYDWKTLYKVLTAETLAQNGNKILDSNQVLSTGLWRLMYKHNIASKCPPPDSLKPLTNEQIDSFNSRLQNYAPFPDKSACIWSNKYKSILVSKNLPTLHWYYQKAIDCGSLAVTANQKFGDRSSLATLARSNDLLTKLKADVGHAIKEVTTRSDYIKFTEQVGVSQEARKYWAEVKDEIDMNIST
ncbi:MAG: hypothetical protein ACFHVJ_00945 [Aestuariibacter sp.]